MSVCFVLGVLLDVCVSDLLVGFVICSVDLMWLLI